MLRNGGVILHDLEYVLDRIRKLYPAYRPVLIFVPRYYRYNDSCTHAVCYHVRFYPYAEGVTSVISHLLYSFSFLPGGLLALVIIAFVCFGVFIVVDIILSIIWVVNQVKNLFSLL